MVDADAIIHNYVQTQKRLLELELRSEEEEQINNHQNDGSGSTELEHSGSKHQQAQEEVTSRVLRNLQIDETSIGLLGRTVLTFASNTSTSSATNLLPSHKLTVGDEVEILTKQTSSYSNNNRRRTGGVITAVTETIISIALFSNPNSQNQTTTTSNSQSTSSSYNNNDENDENTFLGSCGINGPFTLVPKSSIQVHRKLIGALHTLDKYGTSHIPAGPILEFIFDQGFKYREDCREGSRGSIGSTVHRGRLKSFNPNLDSSQLDAIQYALEGNTPMALIHGPPGTGKTTTVAELVHQAVHVHKWKVLVTAPSNVAVDNILERLLATSQIVQQSSKSGTPKLRAVRLGHPARIKPSILSHSLESLVQSHDGTAIVQDVRSELLSYIQIASNPKSRGMDKRVAYREMKGLRKEIRQREGKVVDSLIQDAQVVLATNVGAASHVLDDYCNRQSSGGSGGDRSFDLVVIDEAAQALEASCWIPILRGKRVVLAGDHCQLPPTVKCNNRDVQRDLSKTLFQRVMDMDKTSRNVRSHSDVQEKNIEIYRDNMESKNMDIESGVSKMLQVQYRMHQDIADWASNAMYQGRLQSHESVKSRKLHHLPHVKAESTSSSIIIGEATLLLIDTTGCDMYESTNKAGSRYNEGEASVVKRHVRKLLDIGLKAEDIAIITPYNGQVEFLRSLLLPDIPKLEIRSVDGFQGGEREAVVLSLVRSSEKGGKDGIGFLSDKRRLNVAVTRAKRHCAVICDSETVSRNGFLKGLVDWMEEKGEYMSALEALDTPENPTPLQKTSIMLKHGGTLPADESRKSSKIESRTSSSTEQQHTSNNEEDKIKLRAEIQDTLSFFSQIAADREQTEIASSDYVFVHELCEKLGLLCKIENVEGSIIVFKPENHDKMSHSDNKASSTHGSKEIELAERVSFFAEISEDGEGMEIEDISVQEEQYLKDLCARLNLLFHGRNENRKVLISKPSDSSESLALSSSKESTKVGVSSHANDEIELLERISLFAEVADMNEQIEIELSDENRINKLCKEFQLSCSFDAARKKATISKKTIAIDEKDKDNRSNGAKSIAVERESSEVEIIEQKMPITIDKDVEHISSSTNQNDRNSSADEKNIESAPAKKETQAKSMNQLLGDLAKERVSRSQKSASKPKSLKNATKGKGKTNSKKNVKSKGKKKVEDSDVLIDDDMAFLDAQIEKVQTSHGRIVEGKGKNYRSIVNGILISRPKSETNQKDARLSNALNTKIKNAEKGRRSKKK